MKIFNMNSVLFISVAFLLLFSVVACQKGDIGPQGPEGPQGIQGEKGEDGTTIYNGSGVPPASLGNVGDFYFRTGTTHFYGPKTASGWGTFINLRGPAGPQGATGPQGPAGTANVIYSGWVSFQQAQRDTLIDGTNLKVNHLPAPRLTQAIIDNGMIQVYMRFGTTVLPLPYTSDAGSGTGPAKTSTVSFIPRPGRLFLTRYTHDNTATVGFGSLQFRYVLIPGGVQANANLKNVNLESYSEVKAALGLAD